MSDQTCGNIVGDPRGRFLTRRQALRAAVLGVGGFSAARAFSAQVSADSDLCRDDVAIDAATAMLFCADAPLTPATGLRDARAVWCHVPSRPTAPCSFTCTDTTDM